MLKTLPGSLVVRAPSLFSQSAVSLDHSGVFTDHAHLNLSLRTESKMASLRVLVGCKRVIDYAVKVGHNFVKP